MWEIKKIKKTVFFLFSGWYRKKYIARSALQSRLILYIYHTLCNQLALCRGCWQCTLFGLSASCHLLLWTWEPLSSLLSWGAAEVSKEWDFSEYCEILCVLHRGIPYSGFIRSLCWHLPLYPPPLCFFAHQRNLSASQSATKQVEISLSKHHQK